MIAGAFDLWELGAFRKIRSAWDFCEVDFILFD